MDNKKFLDLNGLRAYHNLVFEEISVVEANGYEYVDLGLPSGLLWATCNVGATSEEESGLYFAWGETDGHAKDSGYDFSSDNYTSKGLDTISTNLTVAQDAACTNLGGTWRMPTNTEFTELYNNTNVTWTTINGVAGRKFANKTDSSKYIFMPAAGIYYGSALNNLNSNGHYWSSTFGVSSGAYSFGFHSDGMYTSSSARLYGRPVRAVLGSTKVTKLKPSLIPEENIPVLDLDLDAFEPEDEYGISGTLTNPVRFPIDIQVGHVKFNTIAGDVYGTINTVRHDGDSVSCTCLCAMDMIPFLFILSALKNNETWDYYTTVRLEDALEACRGVMNVNDQLIPIKTTLNNLSTQVGNIQTALNTIING